MCDLLVALALVSVYRVLGLGGGGGRNYVPSKMFSFTVKNNNSIIEAELLPRYGSDPVSFSVSFIIPFVLHIIRDDPIPS